MFELTVLFFGALAALDLGFRSGVLAIKESKNSGDSNNNNNIVILRRIIIAISCNTCNNSNKRKSNKDDARFCPTLFCSISICCIMLY